MIFQKKEKEDDTITVYRGGEDFQYVTLHINDWYRVLKLLKRHVNTRWEKK